MAEIAVSVILPFHNAETTLGAALQSLLTQQCGCETEFILVNDGSNDHSEELVRYFFALHPEFEERSVLINLPFRQGVAAALSYGIKNARGGYLARLDADDTLCTDAIHNMLSAAIYSDADIVCGKINKIYTGKRTKVVSPTKNFGNLLYMPLDTVNYSLCNKLVKRTLLTQYGIYPLEGIDCWDDVFIMSRVFAMAVKPVVIDESVYNYTINTNVVSLSDTSHDLALRQRLMCSLLVEKWFVENKIAEKYEKFILLMKFHAKIKLLRGEYCDITKWRETYPEVNERIMEITQLPVILRLCFYILDRLPGKVAVKICKALDKLVKR